MNILLLGEYSGLYKNLSEGLKLLGQNVLIAATGDGFKKINNDINLPISSQRSRLLFRYKFYKKLHEIKNYDIVQLINPFTIYHRYFPNYYIIDRIKKNNNSFFFISSRL